MRAGRSTRPKLLFWGQIGNVTLVKFSNLEAPTARRRQGIPNTQSATVCLCFRCLGQAARGLHCDASVNMAAFLPDHVEFNGSQSLHFNGNRALISLTARCCGISMGIRCIYYRPTSISMGSAVRICVQPVGVWKCNTQVLNSWRRLAAIQRHRGVANAARGTVTANPRHCPVAFTAVGLHNTIC